MDKSKFLLLFFSLFLLACHSSPSPDRWLISSEPFTFKIIPGKAKTPSSTMPAGFGPIRGPSIPSSNVEHSFSKDLGRCRDSLLNQQVHFVLNF